MTEIELMRDIGDNIAYELNECGITQQELADETEISEATISRYIHGKVMPSLKNLLNIALVLDCELSDLVNVYELID